MLDKNNLRLIYFFLNNELRTWFNLPSRCDRWALAGQSIQYGVWKLPKSESNLFQRDVSSWDSDDDGLILTDNAVYYTPKDIYDKIVSVRWDEIAYVDNDEKERRIVFHKHNGDVLNTVYSVYFYGSEGAGLYTRLSQYLTKLAHCPYIYELNNIANPIVLPYTSKEMLFLLKNFGREIKYAFEDFAKEFTYNTNTLFKYAQSNLESFGKFVKADKFENLEVATDKDLLRKQYEYVIGEELKGVSIPAFNLVKAAYYKMEDRIEECRQCLLKSLHGCDVSKQNVILSEIDNIETSLRLKGLWDNADYHAHAKSQLMIPATNAILSKVNQNHIQIFRFNNLPNCFEFPGGTPVADTIYIAHPLIPNRFLLCDNYENDIFLEQVEEYTYLLQALGATEIEVVRKHGLNFDELLKHSSNEHVEADLRFANVEADSKSDGIHAKTSNEFVSNRIREVYDPMNKPSVPENLRWLNHNPRWNMLIQKRLNGNLLEHQEEFSTAKDCKISNEDNESLKAIAKIKGIRISAKYEGNISNSENSLRHEETNWVISVKFRSLKEF